MYDEVISLRNLQAFEFYHFFIYPSEGKRDYTVLLQCSLQIVYRHV